MIKLRPYQKEAIQVIKDTFKNKKRQFIEMPTGSGKTVTFLSYAKENHKRILIIVPSKELLNQVYSSSLLFFRIDELSRKGNRFDEEISNVHICIINSIRGEYLDLICKTCFDLVIIDEAHHIQANSYIRLVENMSFNPYFLGVTATPDRQDGLMLNEILQECSFKISIDTLISQNYLSNVEGYSVKTKIDLSEIDDHNGDFSLAQLYKKLSNEHRNNLIVDICLNNLKDRKAIVFCINIAHCKEISGLLIKNGLSSKAIYGAMKEEEKKSILNSFRNGEIDFLCNCQLLTEGFDEPSINGIVLARPTQSRALFIQMIGRGLRIYPKKTSCKIIDIVDNHRNIANFNALITSQNYRPIEEFENFERLKSDVEKLIIEIQEFKLEKTNLLNITDISKEEALISMKELLNEKNIFFIEPISIDEASFLIWHNQLKESSKNGMYRKNDT